VSWAAAAILWYLPLALLPVAIYYWMRVHPATFQWGASYVLDRALRKLKRKVINEHVILLILRVLVALMLILAFARLVFAPKETVQIVRSGRHRVIVLDASYSMLAGDTGQTRWDVARQALEQLMDTWGRGESWSLYVMDDDPGWLVEYAVAGKDRAAVDSLQTLAPCESPASLARAFRAVRDRFDLQKVELFLCTDDQALTWQDAADVVAAPAPQRTYWLNPEISSHANTAVTRVQAAGDRCLRGHPTRVFVGVKHFAETQQDVEVEFLQDGEVVDRKTVLLQPGLEEDIAFDARFAAPGPHWAAARLRPDILRYDDMHTIGFQVEDGLNVLILSDREREAYECTTRIFVELDYVQEELDVGRLVFSLDGGPYTPETCTGKDVVFVDNSTNVDENLAVILRDFVEQGGGLILVPGVGTDQETWNTVFGGAGLLPATLGEHPVWNYNPSTSAYKRLSYYGFGDNVFKAFATFETGRIGEAQFFHWYDLVYDPDEIPAPDILMRFDDHRPAVIRRPLGFGRILLLASGLNGVDNTLPARETFAPFLYRLFREAAAGKILPLTVRTNEPLRFRVPDPDKLDVLAAQFEGEPPKPLKLQTKAGVTFGVLPDGFKRSGAGTIIGLRGATVSRTHFGVQGPRRDSLLVPVDDKTRKHCVDTWNIEEIADGQELVQAVLKDQNGREVYPYVLLIAIVLMLVELAYQKRFTKIVL